jgi:PhzF family phenazine biosynthesis protein
MTIEAPLFVVDAFTQKPFGGNPAAVCLLDAWPPEDVLQSIAFENNLSETAFVVGKGDRRQLRWFTPVTEIDLCGHATLASAHVLMRRIDRSLTRVDFETKSGVLTVVERDDLLVMTFPKRTPEPRSAPAGLVEAIGKRPREVLYARDYLLVFGSEAEVAELAPNIEALKAIDAHGVIVTAPGAPGSNTDYVLRFFAPAVGVSEDPVTGSVQCALVPYWSKRLDKRELFARQISKRVGELHLRDLDPTSIEIAGRAVLYLEGRIRV